ncbi:hypothetical protein JCM8547_001157 [Rhodosporidiobolus lusitaniae]
MAAPPPAADELWTAYSQAPPQQQLYDASLPTHYEGDAYLDASSFPDPGSGVMAPPPAPRDAYGGGGLRIDGYADPAYTFAPQRSFSHGTTPSPALPALSPTSSLSTPTTGFISPQQHFSASSSPHQQRRGSLLPAVSIQDAASLGSSTHSKGNNGWFAEMQETYLQQHQPEQPYAGPSSYALTSSPSVPPPSTPRRRAPTSSHLWRSPTVHSTTSTPSSSPYARPTTPRASGVYPSDGPTSGGRRGSTGGLILESPSSRARSTPRATYGASPTVVDSFGSPSRPGRRAAHLSIEVPANRSSSPMRMPPPSQPVFTQQVAVVAADAGLTEASVLEVEQLLGELGTILESGGSYQQEEELVQPPPQLQQQQRLRGSFQAQRVELVASPSNNRHRVPGGSYPQPPVQQQQLLDPSVFVPTSISISGVTLAEEDLALLDTPSFGGEGFEPPPSAADPYASFPASAPAWRTSFEMPAARRPSQPQMAYETYYAAPPSAQHFQPPPSPSYVPTSSLNIPSSQHPQYLMADPPYRPSSAPRVTMPSTSPLGIAARRRRSSVDSAALAAASSSQLYSHGPHPPLSSSAKSLYSYSRPHPQQQHYQQNSRYPSQHQQQQPFDPRQSLPLLWEQIPRELPTVLQPAPPPGPDRSKTPPPPGSPSKKAVAQKSTPKRKRAATKPKPAVAMFINYSSADSKKLLSGVAPSGSTKKKREEEEAREREKNGLGREAVPTGEVAPVASGSDS